VRKNQEQNPAALGARRLPITAIVVTTLDTGWPVQLKTIATV
jgi:hypothetical protein